MFPPLSTNFLQHQGLRVRINELEEAAKQLNQDYSQDKLKQLHGIYDKFEESVLSHAKYEEEVMFPILNEKKNGVAQKSQEQHTSQDSLFQDIRAHFEAAKSGEAPKVEKLVELIFQLKKDTIDHLAEEEQSLMPLLKNLPLDEQVPIVKRNWESFGETHNERVLPWLLEGLPPPQRDQYLDILNVLFGGDPKYWERVLTWFKQGWQESTWKAFVASKPQLIPQTL